MIKVKNSVNIVTGEVVEVEYTTQLDKIDCVGKIHQINVSTSTDIWELNFEYLSDLDLLKFTFKKNENIPKIFYLHKGLYLFKLSSITSYIIQFLDIDTIEYTSVKNVGT
jgi:hypothetical protein